MGCVMRAERAETESMAGPFPPFAPGKVGGAN